MCASRSIVRGRGGASGCEPRVEVPGSAAGSARALVEAEEETEKEEHRIEAEPFAEAEAEPVAEAEAEPVAETKAALSSSTSLSSDRA